MSEQIRCCSYIVILCDLICTSITCNYGILYHHLENYIMMLFKVVVQVVVVQIKLLIIKWPNPIEIV